MPGIENENFVLPRSNHKNVLDLTSNSFCVCVRARARVRVCETTSSAYLLRILKCQQRFSQ